MIILPEDDGPSSPTKSQINGDVEAGPEERFVPPPPPYMYSGYHHTDLYYPPQPESEVSAETRFFKALVVAMVIWTALGLALKAIFWEQYVKVITDISFTGPAEGDGEVIRCIYSPAWNHTHRRPLTSNFAYEPLLFYPSNSSSDLPRPSKSKSRWRWHPASPDPHIHNATASFSISSMSKLFFFSRGTLSQGSVDFAVGNGRDIEVKVDVVYASKEHFDRASVCLLRRDGDQVGIGIYTPELTAKERRASHTTPYYYPVFNIKVEFPQPTYSHLPIGAPELPIFTVPP